MRRQLTDSQVREVLARAEEIHLGGSATGDSILRAAAEAGLPKEAVEQALRERFQQLEKPPKRGALVFAKSGDGCFYVAKVLESSADGARVEFLAGGDQRVTLEELRQASFTPGQLLTANWPRWGWIPARVESFDSATEEVTMRGWSTTETLSIADVRLEPEREERHGSGSRAAVYFSGFFAGGIVSAIITWLLMR